MENFRVGIEDERVVGEGDCLILRTPGELAVFLIGPRRILPLPFDNAVTRSILVFTVGG